MTRPLALTAAAVTLIASVAAGTLAAQQAAPAGPQPLQRRQPPRPADCAGPRWQVQSDVVERQGVRRRSTRPRAARTTRRAASSSCPIAASPRTCRPTTGGSRSSTTTGRCTPRAGSAFRTRRPAQQHDDAARAQRAARQRHRQRDPLCGGSRRRHRPDRPRHLGGPEVQHADRHAGRRSPRREIERLQRPRGGQRRHGVRHADGDGVRIRPRRGRCGRSRWRAPPRSSCRARRSGSPTASRSTRRGTSSSSTSATTRC